MNLTEFARSRGIKEQTLFRYYQRHKDKFDGHITKHPRTRELVLDAAALKMLDEKYPSPKPVTVIKGVPEEEHNRQIMERDEKIMERDEQIKKLQAQIIELTTKNAEYSLELGSLREKQLLIEQKEELTEKQIEQLTEEKEAAIIEAASYQRTIFGLYRKVLTDRR